MLGLKNNYNSDCVKNVLKNYFCVHCKDNPQNADAHKIKFTFFAREMENKLHEVQKN